MSDSPPEKDVQWSEEGIASAFKFIQKLWNLNIKFFEEIKKNHSEDSDNELEKSTNKFLKDVNINLENFSYNKIIANLHEIYSTLIKQLEKNYEKKSLIKNYQKFLIAITPIIPHFSSECLEALKVKNIEWPSIDETVLKEENVNIVIQINGKKRGLMNVKYETTEKEILKFINKDQTISKHINGKIVKRKIFIKNKLINLII